MTVKQLRAMLEGVSDDARLTIAAQVGTGYTYEFQDVEQVSREVNREARTFPGPDRVAIILYGSSLIRQ